LNLRRLRVDEVKTGNRITEIEDRLRESDVSAVAAAQKERDQLQRKTGALTGQIRDAEDRIGVLEAEAGQVRARIAQISDPEIDRLNAEVDLLERLLTVFQQALSELRDNLRIVIERDASDVFRKLTTDAAYEGLKINDFYGLYIVGGGGSEIPLRSAGAEQIVALSLIDALNGNAVKRGPVIMDTPLGRLDVNHRANVLKYLATMADQVVLLVHSGEFENARDRPIVAPYLHAEYELQYVSSTRTEILPLRTNGA
jgi:DNA sulfur modification protein DndD